MAQSLYKVAVVQAAPAFLDLAAGIEKSIALIAEAANQGARLIAFPECWLPGYPWWAWLDSPAWGMQFVSRHFENCMTADGPEAQVLMAAAIEHNIHVSMGYSERAGGSLYIAQLYLDPDSRTAKPRRKLKATHVERTIFGEGDGSDFQIYETSLGRIGSLCCWEHLNPLNKFAMYAMHEQVHIAAWPGFSLYKGKAYALGAELNNAVSQVYAAEGGCFVLAPTGMVTQAHQDMLCQSDAHRDLLPIGGGAAMIYGPDGAPLCSPVAHDQEGILYADIDLGAILFAKGAADPVGHYARNDVFRLLFDRSSRRPVEAAEPHGRVLDRTWLALEPDLLGDK